MKAPNKLKAFIKKTINKPTPKKVTDNPIKVIEEVRVEE